MIYPSSSSTSRNFLTAVRLLLPLIVLSACGWALWGRIAEMDTIIIIATLRDVTILQWAFAGCATWCSFQAIGRYDVLWHRVLNTGVPDHQAQRAGIRAIALSQFLGFGLIISSLVRWRSLPDLSLWQITRLSLTVTVAFTLSWAGLAVIALWSLGTIRADLPISIPMLFALVTIAIVGSVWARQKLTVKLQFRDLGRILLLTALDLCFAGLALYILIPPGAEIAIGTVIAAYVIAVGISLISNTPGGAGVFELTLLALIVPTSPEPLLAGIIAFRIVYYLIPGLMALIPLAHPVETTTRATTSPAAWGLAQQSGQLCQLAEHRVFLGSLPGVLTTLGPHAKVAKRGPHLAAFRKYAFRKWQIPTLYNCDRRTAKAAHDTGWYVRRVAMEAMIRPGLWSTAGAKRQNLRRKLKSAARAGVRIEIAGQILPLIEMHSIAREWAIAHGGEFGFSMGRFCPQYVSLQRVILIYHHTNLVGFVTFHVGDEDWVLDLIRHRDQRPDGAIHAAIVAGIDQARQENVGHLSLACVPDPRYTPDFWTKTRSGLTQFKRSFAPIWVPRYHAAPNRAAFWITALIIGIAVHRPLPNLWWKATKCGTTLRARIAKPRRVIEVTAKT